MPLIATVGNDNGSEFKIKVGQFYLTINIRGCVLGSAFGKGTRHLSDLLTKIFDIIGEKCRIVLIIQDI